MVVNSQTTFIQNNTQMEEPMKKYLFGLGAMLVGAGLMFVLMHGEVKAEVSDKELEVYCEGTNIDNPKLSQSRDTNDVAYCKIKDLTCVFVNNNGVSCVKS